jgi:hypothetical protein
MTNSTQTKFQEYTQYLLDAFTRSTRSQDCIDRGMNKVYYSIKDDHPDKNHIRQDLIYPLHDDESPNDWRYNTIHTLLCKFVDYEDRQEIEGYIHEIVDGSVDIYNYDLIKWVQENLNRGYVESDLRTDQENIFQLIGLAQYEVISQMACQLLDYIDSNKEEQD